jgi:GT2 family glycosyltransferase
LIYAVIATHNRQRLLTEQVLPALDLSPARIFVVDNASTPPLETDQATVLHDSDQPPNLSRLWNIGLTMAHATAVAEDPGRPYAVLVCNDDVILPPSGVLRLHAAMRACGATIAFPDQHHRGNTLHRTEPGPVPLHERMTGYCWLLDGYAGLRMDERFRWWCGDDDIEWRALARRGGTVLVAGVTVEHLHPDQSTNANPALYEQAGRDKDAFTEKWGQPPW